jgi:hypothetical protein
MSIGRIIKTFPIDDPAYLKWAGIVVAGERGVEYDHHHPQPFGIGRAFLCKRMTFSSKFAVE